MRYTRGCASGGSRSTVRLMCGGNDVVQWSRLGGNLAEFAAVWNLTQVVGCPKPKLHTALLPAIGA